MTDQGFSCQKLQVLVYFGTKTGTCEQMFADYQLHNYANSLDHRFEYHLDKSNEILSQQPAMKDQSHRTAAPISPNNFLFVGS